MNPKSGFTLMEVMIALIIFSVMATGFTRYVWQQADQVHYLSDKTLAAIIASNSMTDLHNAQPFPPEGKTTTQIEMAGRQWQIDISVSNTSVETIHKAEINVALFDMGAQSFSTSLVTLVGFVGKQ